MSLFNFVSNKRVTVGKSTKASDANVIAENTDYLNDVKLSFEGGIMTYYANTVAATAYTTINDDHDWRDRIICIQGVSMSDSTSEPGYAAADYIPGGANDDELKGDLIGSDIDLTVASSFYSADGTTGSARVGKGTVGSSFDHFGLVVSVNSTDGVLRAKGYDDPGVFTENGTLNAIIWATPDLGAYP